MQELLVLGLIPGTNIQITFGLWLVTIYGITSMFATIALVRHHLIRNGLIALAFIRQTRRLPAIYSGRKFVALPVNTLAHS